MAAVVVQWIFDGGELMLMIDDPLPNYPIINDLSYGYFNCYSAKAEGYFSVGD